METLSFPLQMDLRAIQASETLTETQKAQALDDALRVRTQAAFVALNPLLAKARADVALTNGWILEEGEEEVEGIECPKCHGTQTTAHQKQLRSADEPMDIFVKCRKCGFNGKI